MDRIMIDRTMRDELAQSLRHFLSGRLTLREFWRQPPFGWMRDRGVADIVSDFDEWSGDQPQDGRATELLTPSQRAALLRAVLFLHTDLEYRWTWLDDFPWIPWPFARAQGDPDAWPFFHQRELAVARSNPPLLRG